MVYTVCIEDCGSVVVPFIFAFSEISFPFMVIGTLTPCKTWNEEIWTLKDQCIATNLLWHLPSFCHI